MGTIDLRRARLWAGLIDACIECIRTRKASEELTGEEAIFTRFVRGIVQDKQASDGAYAAARSLLGDRGGVERSLTVAYYSALACRRGT